MTWFDKLSSTPAVGYGLENHFASGDHILDCLSPLVSKWPTGKQQNFQIASHETQKIDLQRDNGYLYSVSNQAASITFQHRMKLRNVSGGLPVAQLISEPLIFTKILDSILEELVQVCLLIPNAKQRHVDRIGVVCTTTVAQEDVPPGIAKIIEYFSRPWSGQMPFFNITTTGIVKDDDTSKDRCIHTFARNEVAEDDELITLRFDWQRILKKPIPIEKSTLEKANNAARKAALNYFEELAIGNLFDEHIIRERERGIAS